jgi:hypothetical protein
MTFAIRRHLAPAAALLLAVGGANLRAADELPKGETILDKYVVVTGGKAAYDKIHSEVTSGTMEMGAMGMKAKMTTYQAEPALTYTEVTIEGIGKIQDGFDGKVAWGLSAMQGPRIKQGEERTDAIREAQMHNDVRWRDTFKTAETVGVEAVDGKDCYKVVVTPKEGSPQTRYYDKQSNLLVKVTRTVKSPMGELTAETMLTDYRKEGDIMMPHKMTSKVAGQEIKMTVDSVQYNVEIPKDRFDLPEEIKALVQKEK